MKTKKHPINNAAGSAVRSGYSSTLLCGSALTLLFCASSLNAADVTLTADDSYSEPSFTAAGNWSNGLEPSGGNDYFVTDNRLLRTPGGGTPRVFGGDSLTLGDGSTAGRLAIQGTGAITVNDLRLNGGTIIGYTDSTALSIGGNISLDGQGIITPTGTEGNRKITVNSLIGGAGDLVLSQGQVALTNSGNSYSGGTLITNTSASHALAIVTASADGVFGTGDVRLSAVDNSSVSLTLTGGASNDYLHNSASLIIDGPGVGTITLAYEGIDKIFGLSFDGGTLWAAGGTYGALGSGADFESEFFSGTGLIQVIPEPSAAGIVLATMSVAVVGLRRRKRA